jgi:hypothetical protein
MLLLVIEGNTRLGQFANTIPHGGSHNRVTAGQERATASSAAPVSTDLGEDARDSRPIGVAELEG